MLKHTPVLLKEIIEVLDPRPGEFFIDGTLGGAGHAKEIVKKSRRGESFLLLIGTAIRRQTEKKH